MMKMRSKRDRRPLLTSEVPILSDQMPLDLDEGDPQSGAINNEQGKKAPWKRMFGKGGGSKRKQDENPLLDGGSMDLGPNEYSYPATSVNPQSSEKQHGQQQEQASSHAAINNNIRNSSTNHQSSAISDKRDDSIDSSKNGSKANKQVWDMSNKKDIPQSSPTKPPNRSRSRSRSFMRSLKKKSSQDVSSSSSAAQNSAAPELSKGDEPNIGSTTSKSTSRKYSKQSPGKQHSQQRKRTSSPIPPGSSKSTKDVSNRSDHDVKKILSKPFGREHILITEQTVSRSESMKPRICVCGIADPNSALILVFIIYYALLKVGRPRLPSGMGSRRLLVEI